ncbi:hypothetical protein SAMN06265221_11289 [Paracoccus laeviglucosivorans]|uniref:Glycosyltransferase family 25 (LPS biosynthesis protein) n=2 Tax=Paracoccus laeviglucosivorans TaxID=1197861 RepID=A0A521ECR9_9RHOB|nr:hypothetical protein SAMN06265221_11289 [Paracoccus laeviglucosivorans]
MLQSVGKAWRILGREGVSGAMNRVRHRRDGVLLSDPGNRPERCFVLLGEGVLKTQFRTELKRRHLLSKAEGPKAAQKIVFNPLPTEFDDTSIAAAVLDEDYLNRIRPEDHEILQGIASGCALIVTSDAALRRALALGAALRDISIVPQSAKRAAIRLAIGRWLVYAGLMPPETYLDDLLAFAPPIRSRGRVCISLPEYLDRREGFLDGNAGNFAMFNGIRMLPAWKGCAWSYKAIATKALQSGARRLTICEDDAFFGADFQQYFNAVNRYLDRADWDVFNGVMTRIEGRPEIMMRRKLGANHIIHTPHMMGMVFNVYNRTALEWIADWDPQGGGAQTNTIDEWLNAMPGLKVVSAVPFLAGHREDAHSTIFGFKNTRYSGMIRATEREILALVDPA